MAESKRKWALITGASAGGMGEAEAIAFRSRGINVVATGLEFKEIEHISPTLGSNDGFLVRLNLDVTSAESIRAAVKQVEQLTDGKLHWLMNNAGYGYYMPLLDMDIERAKKQYDVNVWGVLAVTQAFFPMLRAAKGTVVNQASIAGLDGFNRPFMGAYPSSKAAVISLGHQMRVEFAPFDVKVVTLVTSAVNTEFFRNKAGGTIPDSSLYYPVRDQVEHAMGSSLSDMNGHDRHDVAKATIDELLKEPPPVYIKKGYMAAMICLTHYLLPHWILDLLNSTGITALKDLKSAMSEHAKSK